MDVVEDGETAWRMRDTVGRGLGRVGTRLAGVRDRGKLALTLRFCREACLSSSWASLELLCGVLGLAISVMPIALMSSMLTSIDRPLVDWAVGGIEGAEGRRGEALLASEVAEVLDLLGEGGLLGNDDTRHGSGRTDTFYNRTWRRRRRSGGFARAAGIDLM